MVAARPLAVADVDDRRHHGPAQLVGERAAVDEHAGRQVRADLGQVARDRRQRLLGLADAAARERAQQARGCTDASGRRRRVAASPSSTILPAYMTPTRSHIVRMTPRLWAISRTAAFVSAWRLADQVEHARLDRGVEAGRRLVEHQQLRVGGQRDGDDDALLHPARELVRVALERPPPGRRSAPAARASSALSCGLLRVLAEDRERLDDLRADLGRRVQGRAGILVDHRGVVDPELAELVVAHLGDVVAGHEDAAAGDDRRCAAGSAPPRRRWSTCRNRIPRPGRTPRPGEPRT